MTQPHDISDDEILDILGTSPPPSKHKATPRPKEPTALPETPAPPVSLDADVAERPELPAVDERSRRNRSVVIVAIAVAIALGLVTVGTYVLVVYSAEIGAVAVLLILLVIGAVVLALGVIYVLSPLLVVFQLNEFNRRTAETNHLLQHILTQPRTTWPYDRRLPYDYV